MKIHYIQHVEFETPGVIETWSKAQGYTVTGTHTYKGEKLPKAPEFDVLVVMGGPQSASAVDKYLYLGDEIALIRDSLKEQKGIIGICLGAQLIGEALHAKTVKSPHKEIGMYPIELTQDALSDPVFSQFPRSFPVMHWHYDMPGISAEAVLLAQSEGCPHQAFRYGDRVYALQFHLEPDITVIREMIRSCPEDLEHSRYTQTSEELLNADFESINKKMEILLAHVVNVVLLK